MSAKMLYCGMNGKVFRLCGIQIGGSMVKDAETIEVTIEETAIQRKGLVCGKTSTFLSFSMICYKVISVQRK